MTYDITRTSDNKGRGTSKRTGRKQTAGRPLGVSELRIRIGGVEIAVTGTSREDCLRQLEAAAEEVDREAEARYLVTDAGRRVLGQVA